MFFRSRWGRRSHAACCWVASGCGGRLVLAGLGCPPLNTIRPPSKPTIRYALPRPEGQRCLVVAARGQTVARLRSGALLERFASLLPAGGPGQGGGEDCFCILDCVYHAPDQTYYILGGCREDPALLWWCCSGSAEGCPVLRCCAACLHAATPHHHPPSPTHTAQT